MKLSKPARVFFDSEESLVKVGDFFDPTVPIRKFPPCFFVAELWGQGSSGSPEVCAHRSTKFS